MDDGNYGRIKNPFARLRMEQVTWYHFYPSMFNNIGCGPSALALLTGVNPYSYTLKLKTRHSSDRFILTELRKHGYQTRKITKCAVTNNTADILEPVIGSMHLIIASHLVKKNEATWMVHWNGMSVHNFEVVSNHFFVNINYPLLSAYVLFKTEKIKNQKRI